MRLLILNNDTTAVGQLDQLQALCAKHEVSTVTSGQFMADLAGTTMDDYDAVVVFGGYEDGLVWEKSYFIAETEFIMNTSKPLLGIGLGFELICYTFGCQLHEEAERVVAATKVVPTDDGAKIFQGSDPIQVVEEQRWNVEELPRDLVTLARSDTGIEVVKHRAKPIYGLQLQPASFKYTSDGKMVFANVLDSLQKALKPSSS